MQDNYTDICALSSKEQSEFKAMKPTYLSIEAVNRLAQASLLNKVTPEDYEITAKLVANCLETLDLLGEEKVQEVFNQSKENYECIYQYNVLHIASNGVETYLVHSRRSLSDSNHIDMELLTKSLGINFNKNEDELAIYLINGDVDLFIK